MSDGLLKAFDGDMTLVPSVEMTASGPRDRVMKMMAHVLLRVWTRLALESGQKLTMSPSQFVLGMYDGQMKWRLNEQVDYRGIAQLSISGVSKRRYSLAAETYILKGDERARLAFSLEEEKVRNKPVYVTYLVYDAPVAEFDVGGVVAALRPVLSKWLETITSGEDKPLWEYCDENLECVGI